MGKSSLARKALILRNGRAGPPPGANENSGHHEEKIGRRE